MYDPEPVEQVEHLGLTVKVFPDDTGSANDPRDWSQLGIMFCWHPNYTLGDEQFSGPEDVGGARSMQDVARYLFRERGALVALPLYLYDHSGITIRAGEPIYRNSRKDEAARSSGRFALDGAGWDTSMVGYIFTTAEKIAEIGTPKDRIIEALRAEVDEYDDFLTGNVYGYVVEDRDGNHLDSCWGFFPDHEPGREPWAEALAEGISAATSEANTKAVAP
jgi:hypothetical protein